MINSAEAIIEALVIHQIGNKAEFEPIRYSEATISMTDESLQDALLSYFLDGWKTPEFYEFSFSDGNIEMNPMYQYSKAVFQHPESLYENSRKMASYLYEKSGHPNIKSGDLFIAYLKDVMIDDEMVNGIALFKSENKDLFLKMQWQQKTADLVQDVGIALTKIDKACLIFESDKDQGYKVLSIDRTSRGQEALYWKEEFLGLKPKSNEFFQTKQFIQLTKSFVKERIGPLNDLDKSEEAAIMYRSKEFFEKSEEFNQDEYSDALFSKRDDKQQFMEYLNDYQQENQMQLQESFAVSIPAVKNQNRVFRSIIKLDKNFHIYVHGDRRLIEKGEDPDGRKYYKVYFDNES